MMNTAQIIYEQYKVLPRRVREELKALIVNEESIPEPLTLMEEIEGGLREAKAIREGRLPAQTFEDLKNETRNEK